MTMKENKKITRKDFMKGMGVSLAGVAVAGSVGGLLTACSDTDAGTASVDAGTSPNAAEWPMKYVKLDPEEAGARGFKGYKEKGGWGVGVAEGFFGTLADEVGYPFNQIPTEGFTNAAGGYGQATLCGCLGVAATCIGMVTDVDTQKKIVAELFNWYKDFDFPHYQPENLDLTHTVAESVLCADSVGTFMEAHGVAYGDPERKSRCAGVTADTVHKMVELLNEHYGL